MPAVILVTGANRGLGLEFVKQYAEAGWRVIACARDLPGATALRKLAAAHANISLESLDVGSLEQINDLAARLAGQPIDVLLNNAGWLGDRHKQSLAELDYATFEEVLRINTYAPLAMARAFMPHVLAGTQKKIAVITSGLSSLTNTARFGNLYFYRLSKAAVNMAMRTLQAEVRGQGVKVGILAPGMVDTRLLRSSGYEGPGVIEAPQSVAAVMRHIEALTQDAEMTLYTGEKLPW
jgi:NAD(P)-dependent dehydrogenase (short-subunit alcohol dehydrogenase family)